jgi:hypothetical protein
LRSLSGAVAPTVFRDASAPTPAPPADSFDRSAPIAERTLDVTIDLQLEFLRRELQCVHERLVLRHRWLVRRRQMRNRFGVLEQVVQRFLAALEVCPPLRLRLSPVIIQQMPQHRRPRMSHRGEPSTQVGMVVRLDLDRFIALIR